MQRLNCPGFTLRPQITKTNGSERLGPAQSAADPLKVHLLKLAIGNAPPPYGGHDVQQLLGMNLAIIGHVDDRRSRIAATITPELAAGDEAVEGPVPSHDETPVLQLVDDGEHRLESPAVEQASPDLNPPVAVGSGVGVGQRLRPAHAQRHEEGGAESLRRNVNKLAEVVVLGDATVG